MISLFHFVRLAVHNLRRGGQRVVVALLCITFGITALVTMTLLAKSVEQTLLLAPAERIGGDISMARAAEDSILPEHVEQLKALQQNGVIERFTLFALNTSSILFRIPGSGEQHFVGNGMGIEPAQYPLAGALTIGQPSNAHLPTLFQQVGDVVITRDIAQEYTLTVGDPIILADARAGIPLQGTVRGIANDTPNHQGDKIYYTIETAQRLANGQPVVNTAIASTPHSETATTQLESNGWSVHWVAGRGEGSISNLWGMGLRSAGILGLLVGGIGVANTMQVLLRRRQREIAIWKTFGYRQSHLGLIFSIEAGLLGLAGSLLGAGLGVLVSGQVLELLRSTSSVLYQWTFSPNPPLLGILVGTLTTVIFAAWAIVVSSQASPMALLRNEPVDVRSLPGCQFVVLGLLLAVPFIILTSLVMGSVLGGVGVLLFTGMGIAMLGGAFRALLWVCTRILLLRASPLVRMAFTSLQRSGMSLVFAMIALFIGVLSMSMGLVVTQVSELKTTERPIDYQSYNLTILASPEHEIAIRQAILAHNPEKVGVGYRAALQDLRMASGQPLSAMDPVLVGRSDPQDYTIDGAPWGSQPNGVYVSTQANLEAGNQVQATLRDGSPHTLTVVGTYEINDGSLHLAPPAGLLMTAEDFTRVTRPDMLAYFVQAPSGQSSQAAAELSAALPQATVIDLVAYAGRFMHSYRKMFVLAFAMAGLALLAGFLLIANSLSLAMLNRRYEIGILKTVGYSHSQTLSIFALEYGLVSLLATGSAVLLVQGLLAVLAVATHHSPFILLLNLPSLLLIALCGIGLTLLIVLVVTWGPTRVPPIIVLNES